MRRSGARRARAYAAAASLLVLCAGAEAADVVVLKSSDSVAWKATVDALRRSASTHTFTELDLRGSRPEAERVLAGLKGKSVIVVAMGLIAAQAAHELTPELPLVYCMVQDPAKAGLVAANMAGVAFAIPVKNQLAAFRMVNPRGVRIGILYNEENVGRQVQEAVKAGALFRLAIVARPLGSERDVPQALRALFKGDEAVDAVWILPDPILLGDETRRHILSEALKASKPVYSFSAALVPEGALVSNGPDFTSIGEQAADLVNRMAAGDKAKLEMLVPRAELVINTKIADKLKIEIPADALRAASKTF